MDGPNVAYRDTRAHHSRVVLATRLPVIIEILRRLPSNQFRDFSCPPPRAVNPNERTGERTMVQSPRTKKKPIAEKPRTRPSHPSKHSARRTTARAQPDAVSLLRADHKKMRELLNELKSAEKPEQRQRLLAEVKPQMEAHTKIEEELLYPAFLATARTAKDQQLFYEANAEHNAAKLMLQEVASADDTSEEFPGRAKVLKEVVEHHAEEEETD